MPNEQKKTRYCQKRTSNLDNNHSHKLLEFKLKVSILLNDRSLLFGL